MSGSDVAKEECKDSVVEEDDNSQMMEEIMCQPQETSISNQVLREKERTDSFLIKTVTEKMPNEMTNKEQARISAFHQLKAELSSEFE